GGAHRTAGRRVGCRSADHHGADGCRASEEAVACDAARRRRNGWRNGLLIASPINAQINSAEARAPARTSFLFREQRKWSCTAAPKCLRPRTRGARTSGVTCLIVAVPAMEP